VPKPRTKPARTAIAPPRTPARRTPATPRLAPASMLACVASDIHFDLHDPRVWRAFVRWVEDWRPRIIVLNGDVLDFGMLSPYPQESDAPTEAVAQIKCFVAEVNPLARLGGTRVVVVYGNHDERWSKMVCGAGPRAFKGALGLTLEEQCRAQGLDARVEWVKESKSTRGFLLGDVLIRHGHRQAGRFGGGKYLAANRIAKNLGTAEVIGHHHRGQLHAQTAGGRTVVAVANPCMTVDHDYAPDADWQRGFSVVEMHAPDFKRATMYPIIMHGGVFAWGGRTYDGNKP
jgi:predicted phosphodiesterase